MLTRYMFLQQNSVCRGLSSTPTREVRKQTKKKHIVENPLNCALHSEPKKRVIECYKQSRLCETASKYIQYHIYDIIRYLLKSTRSQESRCPKTTRSCFDMK